MTKLQDKWKRGYLDGWAKQAVLPGPQPTIPPVPAIPSGIQDPEQWAYETGKSRGVIDRMESQAGIP